MPLALYFYPTSPPCHAVMIAASALELELDLVFIDVRSQEQMDPEFLKMNPQHTVPTLDDDGFYLSESRAIIMYLADQYAKDDSLYPKDPQLRALINQRIIFDSNCLYRAFADYLLPQIFANQPRSDTDWEKLVTACGLLETFLDGEDYVAAGQFTIADIVLATTVSHLEVCDYDISQHENISRWLNKTKEHVPKFDAIHNPGFGALKLIVKKQLALRDAQNSDEE